MIEPEPKIFFTLADIIAPGLAQPPHPQPKPPVHTPGPTVRYQHQLMAKLLKRLEQEPCFEAYQVEIGTLLGKFDQVEQRYAEEDSRATIQPSFCGTPPDPSKRPVTVDPFTLSVLDYVDNQCTIAAAFIKSAVQLAHDNLPEPWTESNKWLVYERLSELYRQVDTLEGHVSDVAELVLEWSPEGAAETLAWIKVCACHLHDLNEQVRQGLATVQGPLG